MSNLVNRLIEICTSENVRENESMKNHTTFKIGGPADIFVTPTSIDSLKDVINACKEFDTPYFILGNGSNLLVGDKGVRGVVIQLFDKFNDITIKDQELTAKAGALLIRVANEAAKNNLSGLECGSGIPGTIGGAVVMNAGAYGFEMKDVVKSVKVLSKDGEVLDIPGNEMEFGYRHSICNEKEYVVLEATLKLNAGEYDQIQTVMKDCKEKRVTKQPLEYPSAGSTFKRPEGYFAGKLIMDAGLKGYTVGGAQVSEKHAGFVINTGNATASDVMNLVKHCQDVVYEKNQVNLEMEIKRIGEF